MPYGLAGGSPLAPSSTTVGRSRSMAVMRAASAPKLGAVVPTWSGRRIAGAIGGQVSPSTGSRCCGFACCGSRLVGWRRPQLIGGAGFEGFGKGRGFRRGKWTWGLKWSGHLIA